MVKHHDRLSPEDQITIPPEIRDELGIAPGEPMRIEVEAGRIVVQAIPQRLAGSLREFAIQPPPTVEELRDMAEEGWIEGEMHLLEELGLPKP